MLRLIAALAASFAPGAFAHAGEVPSSWTIEPWLVAALAASAALYVVGCARLWRRAGAGRGISRAAAARFALGWIALAAALLPPIDTMAAHLFSVHMVQHELMMVVAAPLLVTGRPLEAWTWALPATWRPLLAAATRVRPLRAGWKAATHPVGAWILHAVALWVWHAPRFFEASLASRGVHELQHASFLGTALLLWWSVLGRDARRNGATSLGSLFTTLLHTGALGALLTFAPTVWYPTYAAAGAYGLTPLEDQQLGGLVMWAPGGLAYLVAGLAIVASWLRSSPAGASPAAAGTRGPGLPAPAHPE
jgi:cytochrome c oxidase assembly factor CtaG